MRQWNGLGWVVTLLVGGALLVGCTTIERSNAISLERTLAAAGFQMKFANNAQKLSSVQAIDPQRKLLPRQQGGETRFIYADAEFCKCLYVGSEAAYQRYQQLAIQQKISQQQQEAADAEEDSMNWGAWGGWGPWR